MNVDSEWATDNLDLWISNDEGLYLMKMRFFDTTATLTARNCKEFAMGVYPDGTPDMSVRDVAHVDWEKLSEEWTDEQEERDK